jgi:hypothetical protein
VLAGFFRPSHVHVRPERDVRAGRSRVPVPAVPDGPGRVRRDLRPLLGNDGWRRGARCAGYCRKRGPNALRGVRGWETAGV